MTDRESRAGRRNRAAQRQGEALPSEAGEDNYTSMDAWQTSVENRLASIDARLGSLDAKGDQGFATLTNRMDQHFTILLSRMDRQFYTLLIGGIIGFVGMAGLMARGFGWL
jgi:hypothetical protein